MAGRIYVVESDEEMTLVRAKSQGQALNHVMKGKYQVRSASADDVVTYMTAGGVVEDVDGEGGGEAQENGGNGEAEAV